jgi:hypothetical protein
MKDSPKAQEGEMSQELRVSAQRELLGAISNTILGVCVDMRGNTIEVRVFAEDILAPDERDALKL